MIRWGDDNNDVTLPDLKDPAHGNRIAFKPPFPAVPGEHDWQDDDDNDDDDDDDVALPDPPMARKNPFKPPFPVVPGETAGDNMVIFMMVMTM